MISNSQTDIKERTDLLEFAVFILALIIMSIAEIRSMLRAKLKKEIVPYLILIVLSAALGWAYLTDPSRDSFSYTIIKLFNLKGY